MTTNYPIMLQLAGKKVVVVGGGKVAERKVRGLLRTGAVIEVVSPKVTDELRKLSKTGQIYWHEKLFAADDIHDAFMIFAATSDPIVNQLIKKVAGPNQLITMADDPDHSDFHVPAHVQHGRLCIAVSTGGASPILASEIRKQLEQQFDERYEEYLEFLNRARQKILLEVADPALKRKLLTAIVSPEFLNSENRDVDFLKIYES